MILQKQNVAMKDSLPFPIVVTNASWHFDSSLGFPPSSYILRVQLYEFDTDNLA